MVLTFRAVELLDKFNAPNKVSNKKNGELVLGADSLIDLNGEIISVDGGVNASTGLPFFTEEMFKMMEKAVPDDLAKRVKPPANE
mgnify:CR=1 FL=1